MEDVGMPQSNFCRDNRWVKTERKTLKKVATGVEYDLRKMGIADWRRRLEDRGVLVEATIRRGQGPSWDVAPEE